MKKQEASLSLEDLKPQKGAGLLLEKAKLHNHLDLLLQEKLPPQFKGLTLCLVEDKKVTLIAGNSSIAFRAEKQKKTLLAIIQQLESLSKTKFISIIVDKKKY